MRTLAVVALSVALLVVGCQKGASTSKPPPATSGPAPPTPQAAARDLCSHWTGGLRADLANAGANDSPVQVPALVTSSAAWARFRADGNVLGDDPAYTKIETAAGLVLSVGGLSDPATLQQGVHNVSAQMDTACQSEG